MKREARVQQLSVGGEVADAKDLRRLRGVLDRPWRKSLGQRTTDDHFDDLRLGEVADRSGSNVAAVAQDREVVAERLHLAHPVRDEYDGDTLPLQFRDHSAEPVDIAPGECRCRLIQKQQARIAEDSPGNLDLLPHSEIEIANIGSEIYVEVDPFEARANIRLGRAAADRYPNGPTGA